MRRNRPALFKGRHFEAEIIVLCVRWYLRFGLSLRNLEEIMAERNLSVDHVTIWRWVQRYAPELNRRCRPELRKTNAVMAVRRDVSSRRREMDVFVPGGRFHRRDDRLPPERQTGRGFGQTLLPEGIAFAGPSPAEGDQCGWKPVLSEGHRRAEADRRTRSAVSLSTRPLPEQYRGAGSPSHQTAGPSQSGLPSLLLGVANASGN